jgi:sec-independent protein translocase protein TatA
MPDPTRILAGILGGQELWLILIIVLVLFGGAKLPALAKGLGQSIKEFKKASREDEPEKKPGQPQAAAETKPAEPKKSEPSGTPGSN